MMKKPVKGLSLSNTNFKDQMENMPDVVDQIVAILMMLGILIFAFRMIFGKRIFEYVVSNVIVEFFKLIFKLIYMIIEKIFDIVLSLYKKLHI